MLHTAGPTRSISPEEIVERAISIAHSNRGQRIGVAGPDSLAAMISLCRAGFQSVECAKQATSSRVQESADMLLVVGHMSGRERRDVIARTCRLLSDGGVLAVQLERGRDDGGVRAALNDAGMRAVSTVFDLPGGGLVTHVLRRAITIDARANRKSLADSGSG